MGGAGGIVPFPKRTVAFRGPCPTGTGFHHVQAQGRPAAPCPAAAAASAPCGARASRQRGSSPPASERSAEEAVRRVFPPFPLASKFGVPFAASAYVPPRRAPKIRVSPSRTSRGPSRSPGLRDEKVGWGTLWRGTKRPRGGRSLRSFPGPAAAPTGRRQAVLSSLPGPGWSRRGGREPRRGGAARGLPEMHREAVARASAWAPLYSAACELLNHACASG